MAELILVIGPMFAEKTTRLVLKCKEAKIAGLRCCIIKYIGDTRYSVNKIITHDNMQSNCEDIIATDDLETVAFEGFDCIFVDEIQFYKNISAMLNWLKAKKKVFCAGLNGDTKGTPWPNVSFLVPYATKIKLLRSVCRKCFNMSAVRSISVEEMKEGQVRIGAEKEYYTTCLSCDLRDDRSGI